MHSIYVSPKWYVIICLLESEQLGRYRHFYSSVSSAVWKKTFIHNTRQLTYCLKVKPYITQQTVE